MNLVVLGVYGIVTLFFSMLTFFLFAVDKTNAAERGYYFRIPERTFSIVEISMDVISKTTFATCGSQDIV